jgi:hypothetical protein
VKRRAWRAYTLCGLRWHRPAARYRRGYGETGDLWELGGGCLGVGDYVERQLYCVDCARLLGPLQRRPGTEEW